MKEMYINGLPDISEKIEARLKYLYGKRESILTEYEKMKEGNLLVCPGSTKQSFRYYLRKTPQDKCGVYLDKSKEKEKKYYARKKYYGKLIRGIDKEIENLNMIVKIKLSDSIKDTFEKLNPGLRRLINPIQVDDETYSKQWKAQPYEGLPFDENDNSSHYSDLGERMRSKSEVLIANALNRANIPYKYECPITGKDGHTFYPDFTILDVRLRREVYWEHLGKMGDMAYVSRNLWKLEEYKQMDIYLGINLFVTSESSVNLMGTKEINRMIDHLLLHYS